MSALHDAPSVRGASPRDKWFRTERRGSGSYDAAVDVSVLYDDSLDAEGQAFQRLYGPWRPLSLEESKDLLDPLGLEWWVVGGLAIKAFTGVSRPHEDIDIGMFRRDVLRLRDGLRGSYHVWAAGQTGLRPLEDPEQEMPDWADQVWLREHALAPWRADVVLGPDRDGRWVSRRDRDFDAPLDEVTFEQGGVRYLNPEVVLSFKAKARRHKDEHDLDAALPLLSDRARDFLADYLDRKEPGHPWRDRL